MQRQPSPNAKDNSLCQGVDRNPAVHSYPLNSVMKMVRSRSLTHSLQAPLKIVPIVTAVTVLITGNCTLGLLDEPVDATETS